MRGVALTCPGFSTGSHGQSRKSVGPAVQIVPRPMKNWYANESHFGPAWV